MPQHLRTEIRPHRRADGWSVCLILVASLGLGLAIHTHLGIRAPLSGDGPSYVGIAESLARGDGFKDPTGPWPDQPTTGRMPAWPMLLAPIIWITPEPLHNAATRIAALLCLAAAGIVFYFLCRQLGVSKKLAAAGGLIPACSLPMIALAYDGMSEGCGVLFAATGIWLILKGGRWIYAGAFLLSAAVMVRTNLVPLPLYFGLMCMFFGSSRRALFCQWRQALAASVVFLSLPAIWTSRNYLITQRGWLLSSIEGETLYGGNNDVVANTLDDWGYWIVPDQRLGEPTKRELAATRREVEVNDHYHAAAIAWIDSNRSQLPRLWLGKLVRSFVPLPWRPHAASYFAFGYRAVLDLLFIALAAKWRRRIDLQYVLFAAAFFIATLTTVFVYWGVYRFVHCFIELFLVPFIVIGLDSKQRESEPRLSDTAAIAYTAAG